MTDTLDAADFVAAGGVLSVDDAVDVDRDYTPECHELEPEEFYYATGHYYLASELRKLLECDGLSPIVFAEDHLWRYRPKLGIWKRLTDAEEHQAVHCLDGANVAGSDGKCRRLTVSAAMVNGIVGELKTIHGVAVPDHFDSAASGIQFSDGFLSFGGMAPELLPSDPDHRARYAYPWAYRDVVRPVRFLEALSQWFHGAPDAAERVRALQEFSGVCLIGRATHFQKCVFSKDSGTGNSGKSTFAKILSAAMPPDSVVSVALQDFNEQNRAMLAGALLNLISDMPEDDIKESAHFKKGVDGGQLHAKSVYSRPFNFSPICGYYVDANGFPRCVDNSESWYRRFIIVGFPNRFGTEPGDLPMVRGLEAIIARDELPGVVKWMLEGAARAIAQDGITHPQSHFAELDAWRRESNVVASWVHEETREVNGFGMTKAEAFRHFNAWRRTCEFKPLPAKDFHRDLTRLVGQPRTLDGYKRYSIERGAEMGQIETPF